MLLLIRNILSKRKLVILLSCLILLSYNRLISQDTNKQTLADKNNNPKATSKINLIQFLEKTLLNQNKLKTFSFKGIIEQTCLVEGTILSFSTNTTFTGSFWQNEILHSKITYMGDTLEAYCTDRRLAYRYNNESWQVTESISPTKNFILDKLFLITQILDNTDNITTRDDGINFFIRINLSVKNRKRLMDKMQNIYREYQGIKVRLNYQEESSFGFLIDKKQNLVKRISIIIPTINTVFKAPIHTEKSKKIYCTNKIKVWLSDFNRVVQRKMPEEVKQKLFK